MTLFDGFFQIGYVGSDIDGVCDTLGRQFGVTKVRRQHRIEWLRAVHTWVGDLMIEVLIPERGALEAYDDYIPDEPARLNIHHHGFRTTDPARWAETRRLVAAAGLPIAVETSIWNDELHMMYVDTRAQFGLYSEYILMTGSAAEGYYADVPHN
ncbi:hypothetical protein [Novosphingobium pentaromativorans]|uniref:VOC domain-containing protein n=1 Tax=Novosphingobium pentaromativorans US6-1 TaxID=1088721 RepID=G6EGH9_9SPHN|nr:hypothetical protein [Novosphingobium pentaromativorans]AIT82106.1 hypothetical protein JI59_21460 [Novosphingobium pentaromativorans US6-1]EHJ59630.1 hypothetical protein NSU_3513 [Novosphingobium pentaromativorans US6-1]